MFLNACRVELLMRLRSFSTHWSRVACTSSRSTCTMYLHSQIPLLLYHLLAHVTSRRSLRCYIDIFPPNTLNTCRVYIHSTVTTVLSVYFMLSITFSFSESWHLRSFRQSRSRSPPTCGGTRVQALHQRVWEQISSPV